MNARNESEKLFERYLDLNGFSSKWIHEPPIQGKNKKPDYLLDYRGRQCFFEVKELRRRSNDPAGAGFVNPYRSLRAEIQEARRKFTEYKQYSCSLVVFNYGDSQAMLDPSTILGAMLGDLGLAAEYDSNKGAPIEGSERDVFGDGGEMINSKRRQPQNATINAVVVLEEFLDNTEVEKAMKDEMERHGRPFEGPELIAVRKELQQIHTIKSVPRLVVVENPYARIALPEDVCVGPFDERWRWTKQTGRAARVFVGNRLKEWEDIKNEA
jgi:hypothetical protein